MNLREHLSAECDKAAAAQFPDPPSGVTERKERRQAVAPGVISKLIRRRSGSPVSTVQLIADLIEAGIITVDINGAR